VIFTQREFAEEVRQGNQSPETPCPPCQGGSGGFAGAQIHQPALRFGQRGFGLNYAARLIANSCKGRARPVSIPSLMPRGDEC